MGQSAQWHVVQGSDGTVYLVSDSGRYTLQPDAISDDDLAAIPDAGTIGPFVGGPPVTPSVGVLPPPETAPDQSVVPQSDVSATPAPDVRAVPAPLELATPTAAGLPNAVVPPPLANGGGIAPPSTARRGLSPPASPGVLGPGGTTGQPSGGLVAPAATLTPTPTSTTAALGPQAPVLLSGAGSQTTRSFTLRGGTYTALWSSTTPSSAPDTFAAILRPAEPANQHTQVIGTALVPGGRTVSGQMQLTNLPEGTYSVEIIGGTNWTLSIALQSSIGAPRP